MAQARVVITKALPFRGGLEEFSNGYWLTTSGSGLSSADWADLIQSLVDVEKALHSGLVQFIRGTGADGRGPIAHLRTLTGNGLAGGTNKLHPEVCVLCQATISRGHYLAKYFHVGALGSAPSTGDGAGFEQVSAHWTTNLPKLTNGLGLHGGAQVCNEAGATPGGNFQIDDYLRVHQFRRGSKRPE